MAATLSTYAIISEGVVRNLIVADYPNAAEVAADSYSDGICVETWSHYYPERVKIPVMIGDIYDSGFFFRRSEDPATGEIILMAVSGYMNTETAIEVHSEEIEINATNINELQGWVDELIIAILEM